MARKPREISENGMYHIYFSGNGREKIFADNEDYEKFLYFIESEGERLSVFAYGLNGKDGHLFVKTFELSAVMKKIMTDYAMWFNRKYGRKGALFATRYKSEPIGEELSPGIVRYIIQKSRINSMSDYKTKSGISDFGYVLSFFESENEFFEYLKKPERCTYGADSPKNTAAEEGAFNAVMGEKSFLSLDNGQRAAAVEKLVSFGLSKSDIARMAGVSRGTVVRCIKMEEKIKRDEIKRRNDDVVLL